MSVRDGGRACYVGIASATTKAEVPKLVLEDEVFCWRCVFVDGDVLGPPPALVRVDKQSMNIFYHGGQY